MDIHNLSLWLLLVNLIDLDKQSANHNKDWQRRHWLRRQALGIFHMRGFHLLSACSMPIEALLLFRYQAQVAGAGQIQIDEHRGTEQDQDDNLDRTQPQYHSAEIKPWSAFSIEGQDAGFKNRITFPSQLHIQHQSNLQTRLLLNIIIINPNGDGDGIRETAGPAHQQYFVYDPAGCSFCCIRSTTSPCTSASHCLHKQWSLHHHWSLHQQWSLHQHRFARICSWHSAWYQTHKTVYGSCTYCELPFKGVLSPRENF